MLGLEADFLVISLTRAPHSKSPLGGGNRGLGQSSLEGKREEKHVFKNIPMYMGKTLFCPSLSRR